MRRSRSQCTAAQVNGKGRKGADRPLSDCSVSGSDGSSGERAESVGGSLRHLPHLWHLIHGCGVLLDCVSSVSSRLWFGDARVNGQRFMSMSAGSGVAGRAGSVASAVEEMAGAGEREVVVVFSWEGSLRGGDGEGDGEVVRRLRVAMLTESVRSGQSRSLQEDEQ